MRRILLTVAVVLTGLPAWAADVPAYQANDCHKSRRSIDLRAQANGLESKFEFGEPGVHMSTPVQMDGGFKIEAHSIFRWKTEVEELGYASDPGDTVDYGILTLAMLPNVDSGTREGWALVITHVSNQCWSDIKSFVADHKIDVRVSEAHVQGAPKP